MNKVKHKQLGIRVPVDAHNKVNAKRIKDGITWKQLTIGLWKLYLGEIKK